MATKRRILIISSLLGITSWLVLRPDPEPTYQGKPLSYWLEAWYQGYDPKSSEPAQVTAREAVRQIGTNAIPALLRMFQSKDSNLKLKLLEFARSKNIHTIKLKTAEAAHFESLQGFYALGPDARSAVPALMEIYDQLNRGPYNTPWDITYIFEHIGPGVEDAIPPLIQDTTSTNADLRSMAVRSLGYLHVWPDLTVPALIKALHDPDATVRGYAASSLASFGADAKSAAPDLVKAFGDRSYDVSKRAADALRKIDPEAAKAGVK